MVKGSDGHTQVDAIQAMLRRIALLQQSIQADRISLTQIQTPLQEMQTRIAQVTQSLEASEKTFEAVAMIHLNSLETIRETQVAMAALQALVATDQAQLQEKDRALHALLRIIEDNRISMKASAVAQSVLETLAFNDPLTSLPNRRLLQERLDRAFLSHQRNHSFGAVLFVDLDRFKQLNDQYGHEAGDGLLKQVAVRLQQGVRDTDTVARYGGDEFVILLCDLATDLSQARLHANRIAQQLSTSLEVHYPLQVNLKHTLTHIEYQCYASIGMVMFGADEATKASVLDWADEAMYWGKSEGGQSVRCYDVLNATEKTLADLYALAISNDVETANHGLRTKEYVKTLARRAMWMNLYPDEINDIIIDRLYKTTPLHDIGKTQIPYAILHKREPLTPSEWAQMQTHTLLGEHILNNIQHKNTHLERFLTMAKEMAGGHHECWDGTGYPRGLAGVAIPLAGRLMAFADVYDALISARSYKKGWPHEQACQDIFSKSGTKFDPLLMQAFMLEQTNFKSIAERHQDH